MDEIRTIPPILTRKEWNALLDHSLVKPSSYIARLNGESVEIIDGSTGKIVPTTGDLFAAISSIIADGIKISVRKANYSVASALNILNSFGELDIEAGTTITSTGSGECIKVGSDSYEPARFRLIGHGCLLTRAALGGTYGIHFENAHLCAAEDFRISNFAQASAYFEGSWGSWLRRIEVPNGPGATGLLLRATQAGPHVANLGDLVAVQQSWLQGTVNGIWVRDNPEKVVIDECDIHDSAVGVLVDGARNLTIKDSYFEANVGHLIHLKGADSIVVGTNIERNFLATDHNIDMIYVENADIVNILKNDLNPPQIGCKLVSAPADSVNRNILLDRNRLGVPAWVTEYNGNAVSLTYHLQCIDPTGVNKGIYAKFPTFQNALRLKWVDNLGNVREVLALEGTNILKMVNYAGTGDIQISPQVSGGYILFYDDGAHYQMGKWTKDFSIPFTMRGDDLGSLGVDDVGKGWYNLATKTFRYWDGTIYRSVVPNPVSLSLIPTLNASFNLGHADYKWYDLYLAGAVRANDLYLTGAIKALAGGVACDFLPDTDNAYDFGKNWLHWKHIYGVDIIASGSVYSGGNVNSDGVFQTGGVQVVGARQSAIGDVTVAGSAEDSVARTAVNSILAALRAHGLIAT